MLIFGICYAYEGIRELSFGEYKSAVSVENDKIRILDFEIKY